jgi:hypothetical protein
MIPFGVVLGVSVAVGGALIVMAIAGVWWWRRNQRSHSLAAARRAQASKMDASLPSHTVVLKGVRVSLTVANSVLLEVPNVLSEFPVVLECVMSHSMHPLATHARLLFVTEATVKRA